MSSLHLAQFGPRTPEIRPEVWDPLKSDGELVKSSINQLRILLLRQNLTRLWYMGPESYDIVKNNLQSNPIWQMAPKLDILKSQ